jgi:hypothetical protein
MGNYGHFARFPVKGRRISLKLRLFGSPSVSEIELSDILRHEWTNVTKWLNNLDLLRAAGLERLIPHGLNGTRGQ